MDTIDKIFTSICKPFEKHLFTPLYRMLVRKKDHEISDDERKLIRLSQSQVILALPILLMTPISIYSTYRLQAESKKPFGNVDKYRKSVGKTVGGLFVLTGTYVALLATYPKALELKVMEFRKNEVQEFVQGEHMIQVFKPKPFVKESTPIEVAKVSKSQPTTTTSSQSN